MAKAYSLDLRQRVFDLLAKGESKLYIEETFRVSTKTILKWQRHYKKTGSIEKITPIRTRPRKLDYKKVGRFIEKNPDKTLKELAKKFGVVESVIWYIVKQLGITYKKTLPVRGKTGRFEKGLSRSSKKYS